MIRGNLFVCPETGFAVSKPHRWEFVPGAWMAPERDALAASDEAREMMRDASLPIAVFAFSHDSIHEMNPTVQVFRRPFQGPGDLDELAVAIRSGFPAMLHRCAFRELTTTAMLAGHRALRYHVEHTILGEPGVSFRCRMIGHSVIRRANVVTMTMATSTRKAYHFDDELQQVLDSVRFH